jgi:undecaprenyl-diphosphatase
MNVTTSPDDPLPPETIVLPARGWSIDPVHALIAAGLCWLGFAGITWLVHTGHTEEIDALGLILWRDPKEFGPLGPSWVAEAVRDITALGGVILRIFFAAAALTALVFLGLKREALKLFGTLASGWLVGVMIKAIVGRSRPEIVPHLTEAGGMSFPSGHSFNAAVVYIAMALAFAALSRRRSVRWTVIGCAFAASLLIALSRVWLGVHYPSDAVAGWLGGAGWAFIALAVLCRPAKAMSDDSA